ncbi:pullulanase [Alkalihalophilus lindianensis]|uniref:Pullulanase n=1 Tax=Alkalihalophilus lindianensis TaxID=1630542 RepID=A0ABU3XEN1_9BACI|nr:pullulanase [Alkalihalophilus lindianensis]MDV2686349.1 pullulanase [Alkalihalophilus lindianensis]
MNTPPIGNELIYLSSGEIISPTEAKIKVVKTDDLYDESIINDGLEFKDKHGNLVAIKQIEMKENDEVLVTGTFSIEQAPFTVTFRGQVISLRLNWKLMDDLYKYEGELGAILHPDGSAILTLWSPLAEMISVILYDKEDQFNVVKDDLLMEQGKDGVWQITLNEGNTGIQDLTNYYYHYVIETNGQKKLGLDPYAKSMAAWDHSGGYSVGKAAIVNPSMIGPDLEFATIDGFEKREDAIIYEVHVRDFTSDPLIEGELSAQFGTYTAFVNKLDYIKELGVTHIQLLPIMSYYKGNERENQVRELEYSSQGNNYNWGYDPHSYFSPSGMYSDNPNSASRRIEELKILIQEIHKRGMGVILDVVYNHTAQVEIFENLVSHYYHFMDSDGTPRTSFGGGRLGTTHFMARKVLIDSILYWVNEFKVDGFRFDMMGDHDSQSIQLAFDQAKALNPNIVMIGEGWRTFVGDEGEEHVTAADQDWMQHTDSVGVFSDEFRNELKSGYGSEGQPRFLTNGARSISQVFDNIKAQPRNFVATSPGDVVPYIEAHDNLTLHDVIAQSIKKDPEFHQEEIHKRIRLGNALVLTSQGTAFLHAGQEYGRTKQYRKQTEVAPYKSTYMVDEEGKPFTYPFFIHDSYNSSDRINSFDWSKVTSSETCPIHHMTRAFTAGLIQLRRSTNAFRLGSKEMVDKHVTLIEAPEVEETDLLIGYKNVSTDGTGTYYVFVNADHKERTLTLQEDLTKGIVLVDGEEAGVSEVINRIGFELTPDKLLIAALTVVIIKIDDDVDK